VVPLLSSTQPAPVYCGEPQIFGLFVQRAITAAVNDNRAKGGTGVSKTFHHGERRHGQRQIRVRGVRREPADLRKLARALIALAQAQAEVEAQAQAQHDPKRAAKRLRQDKNPSSDNESTDKRGDAA